MTRMIRGMWASREMLHENSDKQLFMKTTLRELIIYCVFLFVIVYMTFGQYSSDFYLLRLVLIGTPSMYVRFSGLALTSFSRSRPK